MSDSPTVRQSMNYLMGSSRRSGRTRGGFRMAAGLIVVATAVSVIAIGAHTNPYVPAGHEGYIYERPRIFGTGGYRGSVTGPGNFGISMRRNEAISIDVRPRTYTEPFKILAKDDLNISFDFFAVLSIKPGTVRQVVEAYGGEDWYQRFVEAPFRTYIREAVQSYTSRELKSQRSAIAEHVRGKLTGYLEDTPFVLVSLVVGNIDYPDVVAKAVERKLAAQQVLEEKETQKEIAKRDAEIRVEEAKGIAEAQRIINATLTENYLQHEAINAQITMANSPNHTTVYIPVGTNGIPLVQTTDNQQ